MHLLFPILSDSLPFIDSSCDCLTDTVLFDSIIRISRALETSTDYLLMGVMPQEESNDILSLFEPMDETQRKLAIEILKGILLISGHTPPG